MYLILPYTLVILYIESFWILEIFPLTERHSLNSSLTNIMAKGCKRQLREDENFLHIYKIRIYIFIECVIQGLLYVDTFLSSQTAIWKNL